jgi:ketosteroid isomerase-like protein
MNTERAVPLEEIHPDFELISPITSVSGEAFRGRAGVERWMADVDENFEEFLLLPEEIRESGDRALVLGRIHLRGRGSGLELDQAAAWLIDVRDGMFSRVKTFLDRDEAIAAFEEAG